MKTFLEVGLEAVSLAQEILLQHFDTNVAYERKSDNSPVTIADREAEAAIKELLHQHFPDHGFYGEEEGEQNLGAEFYWVIDPIDGTKSYMRGLPYFATELALVHNSEIILGISNAPVMGKLLQAQKSEGAWLNGARINVSSIANLNDAFVCHGSLRSFIPLGQFENLGQLFANCFAEKGFGDTWGFHYVAEGKIDAIVLAKIKYWDVAAQAIIISEAGGRITDMFGQPLTKESTTVLSSNAILHDTLVSYFKA
jgi:histidinol-phosphatase